MTAPVRIVATVCLLLAWLPVTHAQQTCGGEAATIIGTPGDDDLVGTDADDVIVGLGGNDRIEGGAGNDLICGGDGNDDLLGGDGDDILAGDAGNDVLEGNAGEDACDGVDGIDSAALDCESVSNTDTQVFPGEMFADDGFELPGALYVPFGDALVDGATRDVAIIISHGAMGSFANSVPKIVGLQGAPLGFTVLALDRRDAGEDGGGGAVLFEDATTDVGVGIDLLNRIGYDRIFVTGHSQGTQNASIYPSFTQDQRVAAVGLFGAVDDGRTTASNILFAAPVNPPTDLTPLYDVHIVTAQSLIDAGRGNEVIPFLTTFGVDLFRSGANFLSFWGPDTLSVPMREIAKLQVPALLVRADGDAVTPDSMSQNVLASALAAGVDATYTVLDYPFPLAGFPPGANAHSFVGVERELIATAVDWLEQRVPQANTYTVEVMDTPNPAGNFAPVASAGENIAASGRGTIRLNGSASRDIDADPLTYAWTQTSGDPLPISGANTPSPEITPPFKPQTAEFQLVVATADGASDSDTVQVSFADTDPVISAGGSSTLGLGSLAGLWLAAGLSRRRRLQQLATREDRA